MANSPFSKIFLSILIVVLSIGAGATLRFYTLHADDISAAVSDRLAGLAFLSEPDIIFEEDEESFFADEEDFFADEERTGIDLLLEDGAVDTELTPAPETPEQTPEAPAPPPAETPPADPGIANLVVTGITAEPNPMEWDERVRITAFIANTGTAPAFGVVGVMENTTNGELMATHPSYDLQPGQQLALWQENDYPFFASCENDGWNTLRFTVDPDNTIPESDTTDNSFEITVQVIDCP